MNEPLETIQDVFALLAQRQPAAPAIRVRGRATLTYGHLGTQIRYVGERLRSWGIQPGDIIGAALPSRPELAVAIATLPASCTFAPLDPTLSCEAYAELLTRMKAKAVLVTDGDEHALRAAAHRVGIAEIDVTPEHDGAAGLFTLALGRGESALATRESGDPRFAYILTSSGTTGRRKLVPFEHRTMLRYARAMSEWLDYRPGDTGVHVTPLYLGNGLCANLVNTLVMGHSMVCLQQADIPGFFASIEEFQPTFMIAGFALFQGILRRAPEFRPAIAQNRFRFLRAGSGRLDPDDADRLEQLFGAPMLVGLASSETLQVAHDPLPPRRRKRGSVGLPVVNEVALLNHSGDIVLGRGEGEIVVRGPMVFRGYLDDPKLTAASFVGSWFRTGDLGLIDESGYVHITGRLKEIINRGGEKISPVEIDLAIESLPGVKEAAAFGIPHPTLGEELVAAVVREENATIDEAQVVEHVLARAGARNVPRRVYFVDGLPRTDSGKLRRNALPDLLSVKSGLVAVSPPRIDAEARLSPLEGALAGLWSSLLEVAKVGRDDDFFLLGGDSLRGMQLIAHLETLFGVRLPVQSLFGKAATVAGMARAIEAALAEERASDRRSETAGATDGRIHPRQENGPLPLSHTQMRMWFIERLDPGSTAYNLTSAHRLAGSVDVEALRESLRAIVQRHEILRTTYTIVDDEPRQIVHAAAMPDFQCLALPAARRVDQESALLALIQSESERHFHFEVGPLARFRLIRLANGDHVLLRVWHHIVADGWSAEVFERELSIEYAARVRGAAAVLPALKLQYADYAAWQRAWLKGEDGERQLRYWRDELKDLPTLDLPTDRARPTVQSHRGTRLFVTLPGELVSGMTALGRTERATPFMTLLAAFMVLLHRYTGAQDIAVGTQIAGRQHAELKDLIGVFLNTLVLRGDLSGEPSFRELLVRVRECAQAAYSNQDVPFETLVLDLAPSRDLGRNPLFQISCVWRYPGATLELEGLQVSCLEVPGYSAKFDLMLILCDTEQGLQAIWEYSTDLFERATIERMARHFECLLEGIMIDPDCAIGDLPLLAPTERARLLVEWNATDFEVSIGRCVHHLFEDEVARRPDATAVVFNGKRLTYADLDAHATVLARRLQAEGVGPDVRVGISMERSLEMIVALVGILKAGGAYVPLDPQLPDERLRFMMEDAAIAVLLTQGPLARRFMGARCVVIDIDAPSPPFVPGEPARAARWTDLAYVLYTSGSTGQPKGVAVEHRSVVSLLHWVRATFGDDELAGVLAGTAISFDISIFEIFGTLSWGGKVILVENPIELAGCVHRGEVTLINTVPSIMRTLLVAQGLPESVRTVNLAGEPLSEALVDALYALPHVRRVYDLYGPTETTVYSTCAVRAPQQRATIGRPIANTRIYLLDAAGNPVPARVTGELCIGGAGLARGYLNRPELTAERFVRDPFHPDQDARLYRTGDRARYRHDGCIEFLGRADSQIKLRGFRIELGEIESVLARHPDVREAVVVVREDTPGERRLVAYVDAKDDEPLVADLRAFVERTLPHYMRPDAIIVLPSLPLSPNGKVDRKALPTPTHDPEERGSTYVCASNPLEKLIAGVWCEVLGIERVGVRDNFFELGGHSLLAAQVLARLTTLLKVELPLRLMFEAPTIAEWARDAARLVPGPGDDASSIPA